MFDRFGSAAIVLAAVNAEDGGGRAGSDEGVVFAGKRAEIIKGNRLFKGAASSVYAVEASFDIVVEVDDGSGGGDEGADGLFDFVVDGQLSLGEVEAGEEAVLVEEVIADNGVAVGQGAFFELAGTAEQEG